MGALRAQIDSELRFMRSSGSFYSKKNLHKREVCYCYLESEDAIQFSTQINHIEGSVSSVNGRYYFFQVKSS